MSTTNNVSSYQLNYVEPGTYDVVLVCNAANDTLTDNGNESTFAPNVAEAHTGVVAPSTSGSTTITNDFVTP